MHKLIIIKGTMKGQAFDIEGDTVFIGRSSKNDIQVRDKMVSRKHLKIFKFGKKIFVEDLKSTNGTLINGEIITPGEGFEIGEADTISIGNTMIRMSNFPTGKALEKKNLETQRSRVDIVEKTQLPGERRSLSPKNLELVYRVSELMKQSIGINLFFRKVLEYLIDTLPRIDTAIILLLNKKDKQGSVKVISRSRQGHIKTDVPYSHTVVNQVMRDGNAIRMSNTTYENPDNFADDKRTMQIGSILCVPIISNSEIRGAIYLDSIRKPYGFRKEDLMLLHSLSGPIAVAIEKVALSSR
ncbi:MAG: FHA domain-containing protein [Thermodesulfobacteriota bacterium]|nr:FHA domain-containing protein [Thermodesulfobacteriota bacterium]